MENRTTSRPKNSPTRERQPRNDLDLDEAIQETRETADVETQSDVHLGGDTGFDGIVRSDEAGLGGGLDQAEEAERGITDEELAARIRRERRPRA